VHWAFAWGDGSGRDAFLVQECRSADWLASTRAVVDSLLSAAPVSIGLGVPKKFKNFQKISFKTLSQLLVKVLR
jgi:hypothetical protein